MIRAPLPASALFIDAAPYPLNAGPFFTGAAAPQRCSRGRRMRSVNRVDRSTRVPIAERPVPKPAAAGHGHAGGRWSPAWKPSGTGRTTRPSTGPPRHDSRASHSWSRHCAAVPARSSTGYAPESKRSGGHHCPGSATGRSPPARRTTGTGPTETPRIRRHPASITEPPRSHRR